MSAWTVATACSRQCDERRKEASGQKVWSCFLINSGKYTHLSTASDGKLLERPDVVN